MLNLIPRNKKGDKLLSVYWFVILIIVAGGIFGMVYVFYGTPYDVREIETTLLINNVADCVSYGGVINDTLIYNGVVNPTNQNFLSQCHLNFNSSEWADEQYYTEVNFYKVNSATSVLDIKKGNNNFLASCAIQSGKDYNTLTRCIEKSFYSVDNENNQYIIKILGVVRKSEENVKT